MPKQGDDGLDLPDAAFAPPPEVERPLELDPEWVASRAAKQAEAQRPPPRASIAGVVVAVLLIAAVVAAIVWIVRR
ncbi:MAG: hypothetical protein M4D80_31355 [Myxococcota bacterium]|nr:hypothetical protein [Deltaproteobacteria bacterium]MDQ3339687.1 hypothetical protein [Myxococcota bacterium]